MSSKKLDLLLREVRSCTLCADHLPLGPNPVLRAKPSAKLLIVGQAPGTKVHQTGIPWNDPSGDRLRTWLQCSREQFYDESKIAIIPMGLCYPGRGKSGDLPPRKECAETWHERLLALLPNIELVLLIGQYAQKHYLKDLYLKDSQQELKQKNLTETVREWQSFGPKYFPLPHPSPRNQLWLKKNSWFEAEVVPALRQRCTQLEIGL